MLKKLIRLLVVLLSFFPCHHVQVSAAKPMLAAFIRNDDLWLKIDKQERRLTNREYIRFPKWSKDGSWIAYLRGRKDSRNPDELWLYHLPTNKHLKVKEEVSNHFQWSPRKTELSFMIQNDVYVLTIEPSETLSIHLAAKSIENFSWLPSGDGLLVSKKKNQLLNSDILLYQVMLGKNQQEPVINHFYTVPVGSNEIVVSTSQFKWSHDHRWLSFLLVPTASVSADSNTLCILSADGKLFRRIDEMLNYQDWFRWAPKKNILAYISGTGREANINKQLRAIQATSTKGLVYTPDGLVDGDFTWKNDGWLFVSRLVEDEQAPLHLRPLPSLFKVNASTGKANPASYPELNEGDYAPEFFNRQLFWISNTNPRTADVMFSDGRNVGKHWIKNITLASSYYGKWNWQEVFSLYRL